jgi:hypothetical protein
LGFVVDDSAAVLRRVKIISVAAYVLFAVPVLIQGGLTSFVGLTCSAVVTMINFLWLEAIVNAILQPSPRLRPWKISIRALGRYALLGGAIAVSIFVARFNALSVLLGFSIVVVGIMGEAVYSTVRSFAD